MGILCIMHKRNVSKRFIGDLYKGSVCKTWSTSQNHIGPRFKICVSILGSIYSKTKNISNNVNSILFANKQINREIESDIGIVFMILRQLCTEQLGIIVISCIVYIQHYTTRGTEDIII